MFRSVGHPEQRRQAQATSKDARLSSVLVNRVGKAKSVFFFLKEKSFLSVFANFKRILSFTHIAVSALSATGAVSEQDSQSNTETTDAIVRSGLVT